MTAASEVRRFNAVKKFAHETGLTKKNGALTKRGYEVAVLLVLTDPNIANVVLEHAKA